MIRNFFRRLFCRHTHGRIVDINFEGSTIIDCAHCGKRIKRPLT